MILRRKALR